MGSSHECIIYYREPLIGCRCVLFGQWHTARTRTVFTPAASLLCVPALTGQVNFVALFTFIRETPVCIPKHIIQPVGNEWSALQWCVQGWDCLSPKGYCRERPKRLGSAPLRFNAFRPSRAVNPSVERKVRYLSALGSILIVLCHNSPQTHVSRKQL